MATDRWERIEQQGRKKTRVRTKDYGKGLRWEVRYRDAAGRSCRKRFAYKDEALDFEAQLRMSPRIRASRTTVASLWEPWLAGKRDLKPKTLDSYRSAYGKHISPTLGGRLISSMTASATREWFGQIGSRDSARIALVVLSGMLDIAVQDEMLPTNPARNLKGGQTKRRAVDTLTDKQIKTLARALAPYDLPFWVLVSCGLRFGEMAALSARSVVRYKGADGTERTKLLIDRNVQRAGGQVVYVTPKSGRPREVPCPEWLAAKLPKKGDPLLTDPAGGVWLSDGPWRDLWSAARTKAGLPGLHIHDLRHTYAARQIEAGTELKTLQYVMGHAHLSITVDLYGSMARPSLDQVADISGRTA